MEGPEGLSPAPPGQDSEACQEGSADNLPEPQQEPEALDWADSADIRLEAHPQEEAPD